MRTALTLALGAVLLIWPALVNGYPLVFSDTAGLADMALEPNVGWDKPWVYGPFLLALHGRTTLWLAAIGQGLLVSHLLWLLQGVACGARLRWRHLALCLVLAVGSTAPWFTALLMPDVFTPIVVICLFLLAFGRDRLHGTERGWAAVIGAIAVAAHLAHLILAAACLAAILAVRPRRVLSCAAPVAAAVAILLLTNILGNGVVGISPFGSVFALARLQADGPAARYLQAACPEIAPRFCRWADQLPMDSDAFLWSPDGPIWADGSGPTRVAAEASRVVRATVLAEPGAVVLDALRNTVRQLAMVQIGDALVPDHLRVTVGLVLRTYFPPVENTRLNASLQVAGVLQALAAALIPLHTALIVIGALASAGLSVAMWRARPMVAGLAILVLVGVGANAAATGALSGPHHRYAARIAWLVLLPPLAALGSLGQARADATSTGDRRTSRS